MAVYIVSNGPERFEVTSLRKAKALAGKTGIVFFPHGAFASFATDIFAGIWPVEHKKFAKCGTRPLVRKPKQTDKFLLIARERLQKLLDGVEKIGTCGICAYLTWYNTSNDNSKDEHGYIYYYDLSLSIISELKLRGWDFAALRRESGEYDGKFSPVRRELATKMIELIDNDQLKKASYGYKIK